MSEASNAVFDVWHIYQKVVAANHMFHREIGADVRRVLHARFGAQPFSLLDLGCGDAAALVPVFKGLILQRYKGVDLSETALSLAALNLAALSCPVELARVDMLAALAGETASYSVIYSSFALHHLPTEEKAEFFRRAARCLDKNGLLLLVDVMRDDGENLESYIEHYLGWLRGGFTALDAQELDLVCDHITNSDLPEPVAVLQAQALAAGLGNACRVAQYNWHRVLCFTQE
jgi:SAM-dependent methyltransferase